MENSYINMVEAGIIDPAKVTRGALENAASITLIKMQFSFQTRYPCLLIEGIYFV